MLKPLAAASDRSLSGTALVRIDVNAADSWRLEAVMPTIEHVAERARKTIVISHRGRPTPGKPLGKLSLRSDADALASLTDREVWFVSDTTVPDVRRELQKVPDGAIAVLENIRAFRGESSDSVQFAESLASLGDYYVSDAFPVLHHPAASVTGLPKLLPSYAGFQLEVELEKLGKLQSRTRRPYVVVIGGAKAHDKLGVLESCIERADVVLVGGASANAMLALSGVKVGKSIYERDPKLLAALKPYVGHKKVVLPVDFARADGKILDIGPKTAKLFAKHIAGAKTVLWTGPLGMIEKKRFARGSLEVARAIARNRKAFSVTGGGETVTFLKANKLDKKFSFLSTGGGSMIEFVSGHALPGLEALAGKGKAQKAVKRAAPAKVAPQLPKLAPAYDLFFHNDFDGYASAAVFLDFLKSRGSRVARYFATEYGHQFDDVWNKKDGLARYAGLKKMNPAILVDFRYHPQATFWYDHHATPFSRDDWQKAFQPSPARIIDPDYASACHLVLDALVRDYGYVPSKHIRDLVRWADIIDGARYVSPFQTIALREPALQIESAIGSLQRAATPDGQARPEALPWLVEALATKPVDAVARDARIAEVSARVRHQAKETLSHYRKNTSVRGRVVVSDVTELNARTLRFAPFYLAPEALFGITLSQRGEDVFLGQVGVSPWKRERNSFNIGVLMTRFGGGGHPQVGVMRFSSRADLDKAVDYLVTLFNG